MMCSNLACLLGKVGNYCYAISGKKVTFKKNSFKTVPETHMWRVQINWKGMVLGQKSEFICG